MSVLTASPRVAQAPAAVITAAPCQHHDPELWFSEVPDQVLAAQQLCRTCPLMAACLAGALERREPWGVWGGELFERGVIVARKRPKGRPRKDDGDTAAEAAAALAARLAEVEAELIEELGVALAVVPGPRTAARSAIARPVPAEDRVRPRDGAAA